MRKKIFTGLLLSLISVGLYILSRKNYLIFHSMAEIYGITIAAGIFMVSWNSRRHHENYGLIFLGTAYFFVAIIDFFHTISYKGMGVFTDYSFYANQLWIGARMMECLSLLVFVLICRSKIKVSYWALFMSYGLATILVLMSVFFWKIFPICFVEGHGQTIFKIVSENVICLVLLFTAVMLVRSRRFYDPSLFRLIIASIILTLLSELCFIMYTDNYGITNVIGHLFKIGSFYLIYRSVIVNTLERPFDILYQELTINKDALQVLSDSLKQKVDEQVTELIDKDKLLQNQSRLALMGEMIANIAHQWKQPLNSLALNIQIATQRFEMGKLNVEEMKEYESQEMTQVMYMAQTINDFSDFFSPDKIQCNFDVRKCLDKTIAIINTVYHDNHIKLISDIRDDIFVFGYDNELVQVILNLLNNAKDALLEKKVSEPIVELQVYRKNESACITVSDNAGGIPPENLSKIFDSYFTTKKSGTGIGLYMARMIIEKNFNGHLTAGNTTEGAFFLVELPEVLMS